MMKEGGIEQPEGAVVSLVDDDERLTPSLCVLRLLSESRALRPALS